MLVIKKSLKILSLCLALGILSIGGAIMINVALAAWAPPTVNPPGGNVENLIFDGDDANLGALALTGSITTSGTNLYLNQTTNVKFYTDSKKGFQIRIDSDNNDSSEFTINSGTNEEIFKIDESGNITAAGTIQLGGASPTYQITNVATPTASSSVATRGYVNAAVTAAGGEILKVYEGDGSTFVGNFLGLSGAGENCDDIAYIDASNHMTTMKVRDCSTSGVGTNTLYFKNSNCTGTGYMLDYHPANGFYTLGEGKFEYAGGLGPSCSNYNTPCKGDSKFTTSGCSNDGWGYGADYDIYPIQDFSIRKCGSSRCQIKY